jgi:hypothetical protein
MLGPSLKSVPGCLVSIVPMLIGEPVALTPGLGPHDEVLVEPVLALAVVLELAALDAPLELLLVLLVLPLLLPQAASSSAPTSTASAALTRGAWWFTLTLVLLLAVIRLPRPGWRGEDLIVRHFCMQDRSKNA